jgi:phage FluMu protein Com
MALFRCNKCGHLREVASDYIGKSVKCPKCKEVAPIHDTVAFVENVIKRYRSKCEELHDLKQQNEIAEISELEIVEEISLEAIDIYNTTALTQEDQYSAIVEWFQERQIQVDVNQRAIDTTGFFDEVALGLGNQYGILREVTDKIKRIQHKGYTNVKIPLSSKSQKEIKVITSFCQQLYEYSFVSKYFYQKQDKIIRLTLQTSPTIVNFFTGEWMEWFVFMKLLEYFREKQLPTSCVRSLIVKFPNEDSHELDVFFLINNSIPVCIECKSGEFRQHIDKYSKLRKRLHLDKEQFILCVIGLSQEQAQGLTSMYDLTFVNESNFIQHIEKSL